MTKWQIEPSSPGGVTLGVEPCRPQRCNTGSRLITSSPTGSRTQFSRLRAWYHTDRPWRRWMYELHRWQFHWFGFVVVLRTGCEIHKTKKKLFQKITKPCRIQENKKLVSRVGIEPTISCLWGRCVVTTPSWLLLLKILRFSVVAEIRWMMNWTVSIFHLCKRNSTNS